MWLWQFQMFYQPKAIFQTWLCPHSAWIRCAVVRKVICGLSTSTPKQLPFGKVFGICQSNIIFVQSGSFKAIFKHAPSNLNNFLNCFFSLLKLYVKL